MKLFLFLLTIALTGCGQNRTVTNPHVDESDTHSLTKTYGFTNEAAGSQSHPDEKQ